MESYVKNSYEILFYFANNVENDSFELVPEFVSSYSFSNIVIIVLNVKL